MFAYIVCFSCRPLWSHSGLPGLFLFFSHSMCLPCQCPKNTSEVFTFWSPAILFSQMLVSWLRMCIVDYIAYWNNQSQRGTKWYCTNQVHLKAFMNSLSSPTLNRRRCIIITALMHIQRDIRERFSFPRFFCRAFAIVQFGSSWGRLVFFLTVKEIKVQNTKMGHHIHRGGQPK